jgi:hypothetical protein
MPAVRNFSICAATAVLLDFILQVGASDCNYAAVSFFNYAAVVTSCGSVLAVF